MFWEYIVLAAVLGWAVFFLWRTFVRKRGCACGDCPAAKKASCQMEDGK